MVIFAIVFVAMVIAIMKFSKKKGEDDVNASPGVKRPLRADLRMAVENDNLKFLREKERSASSTARRDTTSSKTSAHGCGSTSSSRG